MSQTTYNATLAAGYAGLLADITASEIVSKRNSDAAAALPFGIGVKQDTADDDAKPPTSLTDKLMGVLVYSNSHNNIGLLTLSATIAGASVLTGDRIDVMTKGKIYAFPEQTVANTDPVYCRFATSVNTGTLTQKGSFRKDADGVAQVSTVTPTAANTTIYVLKVETTDKNGKRSVFEFEYISDGSATATEIVTGFKTLMAADAVFAALVAATGTTTLIMTTVDTTGSVTFTSQSEGDGVLAVAATTPAAATASLVKGAKWATAGSTTVPAMLQFHDLVANS